MNFHKFFDKQTALKSDFFRFVVGFLLYPNYILAF